VRGLACNGPTSPEAAVRKLLSAAEQRDALGALEVLTPAERDSFKNPALDLTKELRRLQILSDGATLEKVDGVDFTFNGVELQSTKLGDNVASVKFTAGSLTTSADPRLLPLGDLTRKIAGDGLKNAKRTTSTTQLTGKDVPQIVTLQSGGHWYVSLWYSVAEAARKDSGKPVPDFGHGVPAVGADTPEAAVRDLADAAVKLDVRRMVELTPPDEAAALHDYAPLFLPDVEKSAKDWTAKISALDLNSTVNGDRGIVRITKLAFTVDNDSETVTYDGKCLDTKYKDDPQSATHSCNDGGIFNSFRGLDSTDPHVPPFPKIPKADLGIRTVKVDGKWYISPTHTVLDNLVAEARAFDRPTIDAIQKWWKDYQKSIESSFNETITNSSGGPVGSLSGSGGGIGLTRGGPALDIAVSISVSNPKSIDDLKSFGLDGQVTTDLSQMSNSVAFVDLATRIAGAPDASGGSTCTWFHAGANGNDIKMSTVTTCTGEPPASTFTKPAF
jgi:hypothetical protein